MLEKNYSDVVMDSVSFFPSSVSFCLKVSMNSLSYEIMLIMPNFIKLDVLSTSIQWELSQTCSDLSSKISVAFSICFRCFALLFHEYEHKGIECCIRAPSYFDAHVNSVGNGALRCLYRISLSNFENMQFIVVLDVCNCQEKLVWAHAAVNFF